MLVVAAALTVAPWTIRNDASSTPSCRSRRSSAPRWPGPTTPRRARTRCNPASWRTLEARRRLPADLQPDPQTPEPVLEQQLRTASIDFIKEHPGYVVTVAFWTTRRMLDLAGMDWSIHTAATIIVGTRGGDRRRDLLLDLRAAGDLRGVHAAGAGGTAVAVGGAAADVPERRLPRGRDAALPHGDRPVHRPARGAGAHAPTRWRPSGPVSQSPSSCGSSSHASASSRPRSISALGELGREEQVAQQLAVQRVGVRRRPAGRGTRAAASGARAAGRRSGGGRPRGRSGRSCRAPAAR